jgi:hypothetical protein
MIATSWRGLIRRKRDVKTGLGILSNLGLI